MTCPRARPNVDGDECVCPGFMVNELWEGLNLKNLRKNGQVTGFWVQHAAFA